MSEQKNPIGLNETVMSEIETICSMDRTVRKLEEMDAAISDGATVGLHVSIKRDGHNGVVVWLDEPDFRAVLTTLTRHTLHRRSKSVSFVRKWAKEELK